MLHYRIAVKLFCERDNTVCISDTVLLLWVWQYCLYLWHSASVVRGQNWASSRFYECKIKFSTLSEFSCLKLKISFTVLCCHFQFPRQHDWKTVGCSEMYVELDSAFDSKKEQEIFHFTEMSRSSLDSTRPPIQWVRFSFPGVNPVCIFR
jgi:hypothetical protein